MVYNLTWSLLTRGTVLGPILFLLHINDLPSVISSKVRLFADDCLVYREIKNRQDQIALQKDLNLLENWGSKWEMRFNAAKCNIMRMSRKQTPISTQYELSGQVLEEVKDAKYLGVTVSDDLEWTKHINAITTRLVFVLGSSRARLSTSSIIEAGVVCSSIIEQYHTNMVNCFIFHFRICILLST